MAGNLDEVQYIIDLGWQRDRGAREEFVEQDLDGVEPVEGLCR